MPVEFLLHTPLMGPKKGQEVEHIRATMHDGPDVVFRVATDEDRATYYREYAAFKKGPPPETDPEASTRARLAQTAKVAVVVPEEAKPPAEDAAPKKKKLFGKG